MDDNSTPDQGKYHSVWVKVIIDSKAFRVKDDNDKKKLEIDFKDPNRKEEEKSIIPNEKKENESDDKTLNDLIALLATVENDKSVPES